MRIDVARAIAFAATFDGAGEEREHEGAERGKKDERREEVGAERVEVGTFIGIHTYATRAAKPSVNASA